MGKKAFKAKLLSKSRAKPFADLLVAFCDVSGFL